MEISGVDHLVLTVTDIDRSVSFYTTILDMRRELSDSGRVFLHFGRCKINLHRYRSEFQPCALQPTPGSADLCFIVSESIDQIDEELRRKNVSIVAGPVLRSGAAGTMRSIYIRDPDGNLIELAHYS
jgi:catechol 2,3-dioxygenase-like lactoylglutathione lyase family enzyme